MKWLAIYTNLTVNGIVRLPPPRSGDIQGGIYIYIYIYIHIYAAISKNQQVIS